VAAGAHPAQGYGLQFVLLAALMHNCTLASANGLLHAAAVSCTCLRHCNS
jgi:hypothetical protein